MPAVCIRKAVPADLEELLRLEQACFETDRLSRRSFRRWLNHGECVFLVSEQNAGLSGYILVIRRRGTRLARMYSLAVDPHYRGQGLASGLVRQAERQARDNGALYMRLEVAADNVQAIALYRSSGYEPFGFYRDYYKDHGDAVRMQRCIHHYEPEHDGRIIPWIAQSTAFTCGPASLMMAMAALQQGYDPSPADEMQIWREATTIFMTSGHGGCHPVGLALAAARRGFGAEVWINQVEPPFLDGVRDPNKKRVMTLAHQAFVEEAQHSGIPIHHADVDQQQLTDAFASGANVLILISTYRMDKKKAPHWVVLSGYDDDCLYVHDPDSGDTSGKVELDARRNPIDCQHLPIARDDFAAMSRFGGSRLRTAVVVRPGA
jgi:ribosomal protein S18 acetylase RimI-like enzyme